MGEAEHTSAIGRLLLAACMCVMLSACLPRKAETSDELTLASSPPVSLSGDMDFADIDHEISLATEMPEALVGEYSMGVSELSEDLEKRHDPLELSDLSLELLPGDQSGAESLLSLPKPGSKEERKIVSRNTSQNLCSGSDTLCITSPYGVRRSSRRAHKGIDIRAPFGSPIMAFRSGVVHKAEFHRSYGFMVEIQQDDGLMARYAHMSQILVSKGSHVQPGFMIGRVGSTGRSTGPHLHFELLRDNRQMNPMIALPSTHNVVKKATPADVAEARKAMASRKGKVSKSASRKVAKKSKGRASSKKIAAKSKSTKKPSAQAQASSKKTTVKKSSSTKAMAKAPAKKTATKATAQKSSKNAARKTGASKSTAVKPNAAAEVSGKKTGAANKKSS